MPCGRKSGTKVKGGGFGKSLSSFKKKDGGGLAYQKPDPTRTRTAGDCEKVVSVMDFVSSEKKDTSILQAKDMDEYLTQSLARYTHNADKKSLVLNSKGCSFNSVKELVVKDALRTTKESVLFGPTSGSTLFQIFHAPTRLTLPQRPFLFRSPSQRILDFATFLGMSLLDNPEGSREAALNEALNLADEKALINCLSVYFQRQENFAALLDSETLVREEANAFSTWRHHMAEVEAATSLVFSPFEKNIAYWKQLWRTIERSDVIVEIVDGRNPLLFESASLRLMAERAGKSLILMINKTDFLSKEQRDVWRSYYSKQNTEVIFFSAARELESQSMKAAVSDKKAHDNGYLSVQTMEVDDGLLDTDGLISYLEKRGRIVTREKSAADALSLKLYEVFENLASRIDPTDRIELYRSLLRNVGDTLEPPITSDVAPKAASTEAESGGDDDDEDEKCSQSSSLEDTASELDSCSLSTQENKDEGYTSSPEQDTSLKSIDISKAVRQKIIGADFLSVFLGPKSSLSHDTKDIQPEAGVAMTQSADDVCADVRPVFGVVGYPNVGKSSIINCLLRGTKRVGVSRTPGKTRHLQTLNIPNSWVTVCDCPGLVFPSVASSKADLVINNVMSADNMKGSMVEAAAKLLEIVEDQVAEIYGVVDEFKALSQYWGCPVYQKAREAVAIIAHARKFYAGGKGGLPDYERTSRMLIKAFTEGKRMSRCVPPPSAVPAEWKAQEQRKWELRRAAFRQKLA